MNTVEQVAGYSGRFPYGDESKRREAAGDASFSTILGGHERESGKAEKSDLHHSEKNNDALSIVNMDVETYNIWGRLNTLKLSAGTIVNMLV